MTDTAARPAINRYFNLSYPHVYSRAAVAAAIKQNRAEWGFRGVEHSLALQQILEITKLEEVKLAGPGERAVTLYTWGKVSPYAIALSIRPGSYLSHGTAAFLHHLIKITPTMIYVNKEQPEKSLRPVPLSQDAISEAFSRPQRRSRQILSYAQWQFMLLSGKYTNRLGVEEMLGPNQEKLWATDLRRTLIDIAVRPAYAGGVYQVLAAYKASRSKVSPEALVAVIKGLKHTYPYHQSVGFYMERAGFDATECEPLLRLGSAHDFFLDYGMTTPAFDSRWHIYYPEGL